MLFIGLNMLGTIIVLSTMENWSDIDLVSGIHRPSISCILAGNRAEVGSQIIVNAHVSAIVIGSRFANGDRPDGIIQYQTDEFIGILSEIPVISRPIKFYDQGLVIIKIWVVGLP